MACLVLTMRDIAEEVVQMPEVKEKDLYSWLNGFLWLAFADLYFFFFSQKLFVRPFLFLSK
jgi:hypothetical protein